MLFRNGALQRLPVNPDSKSPFANQIVAQPDDTVLAAFDDGLAGLRQGKVQWMTTKNGLPCDGVLSFVQDEGEKLVAQHRSVASLSFQIPNSSDGGPTLMR